LSTLQISKPGIFRQHQIKDDERRRFVARLDQRRGAVLDGDDLKSGRPQMS